MTPEELKQLDEALSRYDSGDLCNTGGLYSEIAWNAARTLSQLMHDTHPDLVVVPRTLASVFRGGCTPFDHTDETQVEKFVRSKLAAQKGTE